MTSTNGSGRAHGAGHFRDLALAAFHAGIDAGRPEPVTRNAVERIMQSADADAPTPTAIIAVGKAACAMADAARQAGCMAAGIIVTNDENYREIDGFDVYASAHPVPDMRGLKASDAVEKLVVSLTEDEHLLLLISGGGSALLPAPAPGISLADKMALNEALLASGLDITDNRLCLCGIGRLLCRNFRPVNSLYAIRTLFHHTTETNRDVRVACHEQELVFRLHINHAVIANLQTFP